MNSLILNRLSLFKRPAMHLVKNIRNVSGCYDDKTKCPKGAIIRSPCEDNKTEKPPRMPPVKPTFKSMWANPPCSADEAKCPPVRFDQLYYKMSDKAKRKYQQTWVECPRRRMVKKLICEFPKTKYPPLKRRSRNKRPDTAKCMDKSPMMTCSRSKDGKQNKKCMKITLPGCRAVRSDGVKCKVIRGPKNCKPPKNPYPSFSECNKPKSTPKRPSECECLKIRSMCEVWTILRKKAVL